MLYLSYRSLCPDPGYISISRYYIVSLLNCHRITVKINSVLPSQQITRAFLFFSAFFDLHRVRSRCPLSDVFIYISRYRASDERSEDEHPDLLQGDAA